MSRIKEDEDFRYRIKNRDNLFLFGQILQKRRSDFYSGEFIPTLNSILKEGDFNAEAKFTVAQALAALGAGSKECINTLLEVMEHGKPFWKQNIAAIGLIDLQDPRGHDYLFKEMEKPDQERHFFAALGLGLAMARNDPIKLDENDRQTLSKRLEEGRDQNQTGNQFQRDLAEAILKRLKEKDKLQSSK